MKKKSLREAIIPFAFGCAGLFIAIGASFAILLFIRNDQIIAFVEFTLRVLISLAAAGVASTIPGFLEVSLQTSIDNKIKAGGAIAVFVLVYLLNPPSLISQNRITEDTIRRAESAYNAYNFREALELFTQANTLDPSRYEPHHGLARIYQRRRNFPLAEIEYQKSIELAMATSGHRDARMLRALAGIYDSLGRSREAYDTIKAANDLLVPGTTIYYSVIYGRGVYAMKLWRDTGKSNTDLYEDSERHLTIFLRARDSSWPTFWAHYHIACLFAGRARMEDISEAEKNDLRAKIRDHVREAIMEVGRDNFDNPAMGEIRGLLRAMLGAEAAACPRMPEYPSYCPDLPPFVTDIYNQERNRAFCG